MWRHRNQLEADLQRWREAGWVTPEGGDAILQELRGRSGIFRLPAILAMLGAVLLGFAAMSFVAANWQEMSKLVRLVVLAASLWAAYGLAGWLFQRGYEAFAHIAVLTGLSVYGAAIMLIAQMYHIDKHPPDAVLVWGAGVLLAGVLLRSNPALILAMLLTALWSGWETAISSEVHWPFLGAWAAVTLAFVWQRWQPGLHLAALVLAVWVVSLGYLLNDGHAHVPVFILGILASAVAGAVASLPPLPVLGHAGQLTARQSLGYAAGVSYAALFALQFIEEPSTSWLIMMAAVSLVLLVGAIVFALRTGNRGLLWFAYTAFSIEVMALYFKSVGTLLGSSLFFFTAGLVVIALAFIAYRLHARSETQRGAL